MDRALCILRRVSPITMFYTVSTVRRPRCEPSPLDPRSFKPLYIKNTRVEPPGTSLNGPSLRGSPSVTRVTFHGLDLGYRPSGPLEPSKWRGYPPETKESTSTSPNSMLPSMSTLSTFNVSYGVDTPRSRHNICNV